LPAPESAASPDPSVLHGSWQLERWEIAYSDGRPHTLPFGPDATGLIVYTQDGCMSACIARASRAVLSGQSTRTVPAHEQAAAFESYFHYAGRYHTRHHEGRDMVLEDSDRLTLSASDPLPGKPEVMRHHRLIWRRKGRS
jgi:hypothetical protein